MVATKKNSPAPYKDLLKQILDVIVQLHKETQQ
jgi:hypothetical protein